MEFSWMLDSWAIIRGHEPVGINHYHRWTPGNGISQCFEGNPLGNYGIAWLMAVAQIVTVMLCGYRTPMLTASTTKHLNWRAIGVGCSDASTIRLGWFSRAKAVYYWGTTVQVEGPKERSVFYLADANNLRIQARCHWQSNILAASPVCALVGLLIKVCVRETIHWIKMEYQFWKFTLFSSCVSPGVTQES